MFSTHFSANHNVKKALSFIHAAGLHLPSHCKHLPPAAYSSELPLLFISNLCFVQIESPSGSSPWLVRSDLSRDDRGEKCKAQKGAPSPFCGGLHFSRPSKQRSFCCCPTFDPHKASAMIYIQIKIRSQASTCFISRSISSMWWSASAESSGSRLSSMPGRKPESLENEAATNANGPKQLLDSQRAKLP